MSRSSIQIEKEKAKGNGDCAFNAWVLAFSQEKNLNKIEQELMRLNERPDEVFAQFIQYTKEELIKLNSELTLENWQDVKNYLIFLRTNDKNFLQDFFAPIMRRLALDLAENSIEYQTNSEETLLAAFSDYVYTQLSIPMRGVEDDIYQQHPLIVQKFSELLIQGRDAQQIVDVEQMIKQQQILLINWWREKGYQLFLQQMKEPGQWAGHLELSQLAIYFRTNLLVKKPHYCSHIHLNYGEIPIVESGLQAETIDLLKQKEIINIVQTDAGTVQLLGLSKREIRERLSDLDNADELATLCDQYRSFSPTILLFHLFLHWDSSIVARKHNRKTKNATEPHESSSIISRDTFLDCAESRSNSERALATIPVNEKLEAQILKVDQYQQALLLAFSNGEFSKEKRQEVETKIARESDPVQKQILQDELLARKLQYQECHQFFAKQKDKARDKDKKMLEEYKLQKRRITF